MMEQTLRVPRQIYLMIAIVYDVIFLIYILFEHCPREANYVTHELAKFSAASVWMDEAHALITPLFVKDVTLIFL